MKRMTAILLGTLISGAALASDIETELSMARNTAMILNMEATAALWQAEQQKQTSQMCIKMMPQLRAFHARQSLIFLIAEKQARLNADPKDIIENYDHTVKHLVIALDVANQCGGKIQ